MHIHMDAMVPASTHRSSLRRSWSAVLCILAICCLVSLSSSAEGLVITATQRGSLRDTPNGTAAEDFSGLDAWIDVHWEGIPTPRLSELGLNDIVALYTQNSDAPINITEQDPFAYIYPFLVSPVDWLKGVGSYSFYLTNHRVPIVVLYLRGHSYYNATIESQVTINNTSPNIPMQVTLAVTTDRSVYRVTWSVRDDFPGSVRWGRSPSAFPHQTASNTSTYTRGQLCGLTAGGPGWSSPGTINTAFLTDLKPNTRYYYMVGSPVHGLSQVFIFITPHSNTIRMLAWADHGGYNPDGARPVLGTFADQFEVAIGTSTPLLELTYVSCLFNVLGLGIQNGAWVTSAALAADARNNTYHVAAVNGDLSYAYGSLQRWDTWLHQVQAVSTSMPLITSPGNHESDSFLLPQSAFPPSGEDSGGECGVPYEQRMGMPTAAPRREWFSSDIGPVHFLQISTEQNFNTSSEQYEFILADLKSVDRSKTPWLIAGFHRPMYVDDPDNGPTGNYRVSSWLRTHLEPLFVQYQVDMTWTGHVHAYHRSCPVINGTCVGADPKTGEALAPVHIIMGHAGGSPGLVTFAQVPSWAVVDESPSFGYCTVEASKTRLSMVVFGGNRTDGAALPVMDRVTLRKPRGWRPDPAAARRRYEAAATPGTPPPPSVYSSADLISVITTVNAKLGSLVKEQPALGLLFAACFGPDTKAYKMSNAVSLPIMTATNAWEFQYPILTLLKAAFKPDPLDPDQQRWSAALDFAYGLLDSGRQRLGAPAPGCHL